MLLGNLTRSKMLVVLEGSCLGRVDSLKRYVRRLKKKAFWFFSEEMREQEEGITRLDCSDQQLSTMEEMLFPMLHEKPILLVSSPFQLRTKNS